MEELTQQVSQLSNTVQEQILNAANMVSEMEATADAHEGKSAAVFVEIQNVRELNNELKDKLRSSEACSSST